MIDVLVVGGGPVGLATAIRCAQQGLSVTVAEPRTAPVDKACGEGVLPAAVRRLAELGVVPDGHPLHGIRYLDARHRADAPFRHGHGLGVRRTVLHAALAERAAALGITVIPQRVSGSDRRAGHVVAAGIEARYLVAADGLHSTIRRALERESPAGNEHGKPARSGAASNGAPRNPAPRHPAPRNPAPRNPALPRYGLRRHYHVPPWTDMVEVYWSATAEAYVTPVSPDTVGVALLFAKPPRTAAPDPDGTGPRHEAGTDGDYDARLAAFPALLDRLGGAPSASAVRGAGPLRHDVARRVHGRVLLVGDASGYLDALTGEGIGVGLAQADVLARCLAADRAQEYERAWRRVSGPAWRFTAGVLWSRNQPLLGPRIVPAAQRLPWLLSALVNYAAQALARQGPGPRRGYRRKEAVTARRPGAPPVSVGRCDRSPPRREAHRGSSRTVFREGDIRCGPGDPSRTGQLSLTRRRR
jgi:2-polyprenyl-6-methoxyphenol hydroxylase-like FAD-dependent oxidoreductase